jgi:hypothetical protein
MTTIQKKSPAPAVRIPNRRSLDEIASEIHKRQRDDVFAVGDLLLEAKDGCEHGEFLEWLYEEFEYSEDSAERYMKVARLGTKFRSLRNLKLPKVTLYVLADLDKKEPDALPAIIKALEKEATKKRLKPAEAEDVIELARLRNQHGDLPDATLVALGWDVPSGAEWRDKVVEALKAKKPDTPQAAEEIVEDIQRDHVQRLYHGELPGDIPSDALSNLESVPAERRVAVQRALSDEAESGPLTTEVIYEVCCRCGIRKPDDEQQEEEEEQEQKQEQVPILRDRRKNSAPASKPDPFASGLSMVTAGVEAMLIAKSDAVDEHAVFEHVRQHINEMEQVRSPSVVPVGKPSPKEDDGLDIPDYLRREPKNEAIATGAEGEAMTVGCSA